MKLTNSKKTLHESICSLFLPHSKLHLAETLLLTFFTLYRILCEWGITDATEIYKEFTVTYATWFDVNKTAELQVMNLLMLGVPVCFFLFGFLLNGWKPVCEKLPAAELLPVFCMMILWLGRYYVSLLCVIGGAAAAMYYLVICRNAHSKTLKQTVLLLLLHQYIAQIIGQGMFCFFPKLWTAEMTQTAGLALLIADMLLILCIKALPQFLEKSISLTQLFLPLVFLYLWRFPYRQSDDTVVFYHHSPLWMVFCLVSFGLMLFLAVRSFHKKTEVLWLSSVISMAAALGYCIPNYAMLSDWFHYGEYTVTTQQLLSYGSLPYFDFYPIHGLCDYVYSLAAALFYDGSMAALSGGVVIGNTLAICVLAAVVWLTAKQKTAASLLMLLLLHPTVFTAYGYNYMIRWLMAFVALMILNSSHVREDAIKSAYLWVWLSMAGILWNPSIGGVMAIAFLPVLLRRSLSAAGRAQWLALKTPTTRRYWLIRFIPLLICGLCYIPVFLHIVQYILENAGTTASTNGSAMFAEGDLDAASAALPWLRKFAMPLFIVFLLVMWWQYRHKADRYHITDSLLLTLFAAPLTANYIFVRYDDGDRAVFFYMLLAVCVMLPMLAALYGHSDSSAGKRTLWSIGSAVIGFTLCLCDVLPVMTPMLQTEWGGIPTDQITVSGEDMGLPKLGEGMLPEYKARIAADYAAVCNAVCTEETDTVFNGTLHIGLTVAADQKLATKYTSLYNISNQAMQQRALEQLKEAPPKLVILQNGTLIDEMPTSMRCFPIYKWLLEEGYLPYTCGTILFMTKGSDLPANARLNWLRFFQMMTPEDLQLLPKVWAKAEAAEDLLPCTTSLQTDTGGRLGNTITCKLQSSQAVNGSSCDFLKLTVTDIAEGTKGTLSFTYDACGLQGTTDVDFIVSQGTMLIPLSVMPQWYCSDAITNIRLLFRGEDAGQFGEAVAVDAALYAYPNA